MGSRQTAPEHPVSSRAALTAAEVLSPETGGFSGRPHSHGATPVPGGSRGEAVRSFDLAAFPFPSGREEDWRFTPLERLRGLLDGEASEDHLKWEATLPTGVRVTEVSTAEAVALGVPKPVDRLSALAVANSGRAVLVDVPAEAEAADPLALRLTGSSPEDLVWGHVVVRIGRYAKATVVFEHTGSARYGTSVALLVGDGAQVDVASLQLWDDDAVHAGHVGIRMGRDARLRSFQASLGGDLVRLVETVEYDGPGGEVEMYGLFFADAGQHLEHRLLVDHSQPHCRSRVTYKGALQGAEAHSVWVGDVLIRPQAVGTDTFELNRNLVLTDGARADSVPNLEIETGEIVGAGHASATGRFDDEQLFYLQSRGIPTDEARRLVVRGFFADIITRITVPEVRARLLAAVDAELEGALG